MSKLKFPSLLIIAIVLTIGLSVSLQSLLAAWTAPTSAPTGGNVSAPIYSSSSVSQTIGGANGSLGVGGAFTVTGNSSFTGNVGIGTTSPVAKLSVNGAIGGVTAKTYGGIDVWGKKNGYSGIAFFDNTGNYESTFMVDVDGATGMYKEGTGWQWYFNSAGNLDVGTVPAAGTMTGVQKNGPYPGSTAGTYYHLGSWGGNGWGPDVLVERARYADIAGDVPATAKALNQYVNTTSAPTFSGATIGGRLTVYEAGGAYTYITLLDDESANGAKYIHANSNVIGFLNGSGNWVAYWDAAGNMQNIGGMTINNNLYLQGYRVVPYGGIYSNYGGNCYSPNPFTGWCSCPQGNPRLLIDSNWYTIYVCG